jgi:hypothetical protein
MGPCYYKPDAANAVSMKIGLPSKSSIPIAVMPGAEWAANARVRSSGSRFRDSLAGKTL